MTTQQRNKLGLLVIALLVGIKLIIVPWVNWIDDKALRVQQLSKNVSRFERVEFRKTELADKEQKIKESYEQLNNMWETATSTQASVAIRRYLEATAKEWDVNLKNTNTSKINMAETSTMSVSLYLSAAPEAVLAFMAALEKGKPAMLIARANVQKPNMNSVEITATLDILVLMKYQEPTDEAN